MRYVQNINSLGIFINIEYNYMCKSRLLGWKRDKTEFSPSCAQFGTLKGIGFE